MCQGSTWKTRLRATSYPKLRSDPSQAEEETEEHPGEQHREPRLEVSCTAWQRTTENPSVKCREQGKNTAWQALKLPFLTQVTADTVLSIKGTMY